MRTAVVDRMTPKERMVAFRAGKPIDRIPCCPGIENSGIRLLGMKFRDYATDATSMADAAIACFKIYRPDSVGCSSDCFTISEAMGSVLNFPEDDVPQLLTPIVKTRADVKKLRGADPKKDGRLQVFVEATKKCVRAIGDEVFISAATGGPFTTAAGLRGTENFARDIYRDPELVHELLKLSLESCLTFTDAIHDAGGSAEFSEPIASCSLISEKHFREFALPYLIPLVERIKHYEGGSASLHVCGKTMNILSALVETGVTTLSLDNVVDIAEVKRLIGDKVCLTGNVPPTEVLFKGTPEMVDASVYEILRKGYDNPRGFIMSTGCGVPTDAPPENIHALMNAVRKYGAWPVTFDD
ncbi:MAG: uroporphyrinogen decarboxylase family protein [Candidatus Bathyarchaeota archaeon]|nr:uroporphyrinogen decarboxylase family protein [Candidatus Bathyarchaeota archaeon]